MSQLDLPQSAREPTLSHTLGGQYGKGGGGMFKAAYSLDGECVGSSGKRAGSRLLNVFEIKIYFFMSLASRDLPLQFRHKTYKQMYTNVYK